MNSKLLLSAIVLFAWPGARAARAQDAPAKPKSPFLVVPTDASWTMTVNAAGGSLPPTPPPAVRANGLSQWPAPLRARKVVQKGKIRHETSEWSDGSTTETWILDGKRFLILPGGRGITLIDPARDRLSAASDMREDFLSITWLSEGTFVRTESYKGRPCYLFEKHSAPPPSPPVAGSNSDAYDLALMNNAPGRTWIDVETKLMAAYSDGSKLYTFVFGPPPTGELTPPAEITKLARKYEDDMNPLKIPIAPSR